MAWMSKEGTRGHRVEHLSVPGADEGTSNQQDSADTTDRTLV